MIKPGSDWGVIKEQIQGANIREQILNRATLGEKLLAINDE